MRLTVVPGSNNKTYVAIQDIVTKEDMELHDVIGKVLSRTEFKPFLQGFNKTISFSYLFNEIFFPVQFWDDVKKQLEKISSTPITLINEDMMYNNDITRDHFDEFVESLQLPEDIDTVSEDYVFQQDSAFLAIQNKIARIDVSMAGGKTFITYMYCRYLHEYIIPKNKKILIVVPSKLLCQQLQKDFGHYDSKYKQNPKEEGERRKLVVETIYSGATKYLDSDIICGTYQSLCNYDIEYFTDFSVVICDEVQGAKAYSIKNEIYTKTLNAEYFFGMSGTHPDYKTLDYLHIVSMFGKVVVTKTSAELIDAGIITPVKISAIKINYKEAGGFAQALKDQGILGTEKYAMEKEWFHSNKDRTKLIGKLLNGIKGNSLIIVDTVEYCSQLKEYLVEFCPGIRFEIIHGKVNNRTDIIEEMRISTEFALIGTYGTMSTGVSIKNIANIYFPDGGKSERRIRQTCGRGMRLFPDKEFCNVFDFQDMMPCCAFKNHAAERNRIYRKEQFPIKIINVEL